MERGFGLDPRAGADVVSAWCLAAGTLSAIPLESCPSWVGARTCSKVASDDKPDRPLAAHSVARRARAIYVDRCGGEKSN